MDADSERRPEAPDPSPAPAASGRSATWPRRVRGRSFASEREMVLHFLDELRAAETFGGIVLALWAEVTRDETLRADLRSIGEREARHGRLLAERLSALGGRPERTLPAAARESARARLGSATLSDGAKIRHLLDRLPDVSAATAPLREILEGIAEDGETRALLESIFEDEAATWRWLHATAVRLGIAPAGEVA